MKQYTRPCPCLPEHPEDSPKVLEGLQGDRTRGLAGMECVVPSHANLMGRVRSLVIEDTGCEQILNAPEDVDSFRVLGRPSPLRRGFLLAPLDRLQPASLQILARRNRPRSPTYSRRSA